MIFHRLKKNSFIDILRVSQFLSIDLGFFKNFIFLFLSSFLLVNDLAILYFDSLHLFFPFVTLMSSMYSS